MMMITIKIIKIVREQNIIVSMTEITIKIKKINKIIPKKLIMTQKSVKSTRRNKRHFRIFF